MMPHSYGAIFELVGFCRGASSFDPMNDPAAKRTPSPSRRTIGMYWSTASRFYHDTLSAGTF